MQQPTIWMIRPWIEDFSAFDHFAQPLGFLEIAAHLIRAGCDVRYIDALRMPGNEVSHAGSPAVTPGTKILHGYDHTRVEKPPVFDCVPRYYKRFGVSVEQLAGALEALPDPAAVLITTGMTYWFQGVRAVAELVRLRCPDVPVALGGVYASLVPEHARWLFPGAAVFPGAAGAPFYRWLSSRTALDGDALTETAAEPPVPAWGLLPEHPYAVVAISRGCFRSCAYCAASLLHGGWEPKPAGAVRREVEWLAGRLGVREIALYDDDLGCPTPEGLAHLMAFLEMLDEMRLPVRWHLPNAVGVDSVSESVARLMARTGFEQPRLSLHHLDRRLTEGGFDAEALDAFRSAAAALADAGYDAKSVSTYIVAGLPAQRLDWLRKGTDQLLDAGIRPYLAQFSPIPGTPQGDLRLEQLGYRGSGDLLLTNKILSVYAHPGWTAQQYLEFAGELKLARE